MLADKVMRQDPEKENIGETMHDRNEGQAFCFVEEKAYKEADKASIENLVEGTISGMHESKQETGNYKGFPHTQRLLKPCLDD